MLLLTMFNLKKFTGLHITTNHTGKMSGMYSLSTCCLFNKYCQKYKNDPTKVCCHCYAQTMMKMYKKMVKCLKRNTELLTENILDYESLPYINALYFRFEAFGDLNNDIQVINYFNICKKNPNVKFALWTKNPFLIKKAIESGHEKPDNLVIVLSSHYLNVVADKSRYPFVDKVFTVYSSDFIAENNICINCGANSCLLCHKCYEKNDEVYVNEKLK